MAISTKPRQTIPKETLKQQLDTTKEQMSLGLQFSFKMLDRHHELFNMGDNSKGGSEVIEGNWFLDLLDCFKEVSKLTINEFISDRSKNKTYDPHSPDWMNSNVSLPEGAEQFEWLQFRLSKTKGRIIGIILENTFYVVWIDRYHNFQDCIGYPKAYPRFAPLSEYEKLILEKKELEDTILNLQEENKCYADLFDEISNGKA